MFGKTKTQTIPILPLQPPSVLLPGTSLRVPVINRADVVAVLAKVYAQTTSVSLDAPIQVGCVPLRSKVLSPDGKLLIEDKGGNGGVPRQPIDVLEARKEDLFGYGCLAKISAVQGRNEGQLSLIVEGMSRFEVGKIVQEKPFFEAEFVPIEEEPIHPKDAEIHQLFESMKQLSREFLALVRLSSILTRNAAVPLSPILARRVESYIRSKETPDAGSLADYMTGIIDCTLEDRLRILSALTIKERLERVIEVLQRQITKLQSNGTVISIKTATNTPAGDSDVERLRKVQDALKSRLGGLGPFMAGMPGMPQGNNGEDNNELEELKKRLQEARLSPDAQKVADRELQRLQKMNTAQAEYQVCRNYLENLAEIPWSKTTRDLLDTATLTRARTQLNDDHYGLEKIKKRLLEYLAVLKLKQAVNADIEGQIKQLTENVEAKEIQEESQNDRGSPPRVQSEEETRLLEKKRMIDKSPILLLVGPPGTGKTSLAKSIATALGRKFHRISLGGVRDEAEIRGHRRTYVAAMPGLIVNGLKKVGVSNPVFLLDEIDKLGMSNFHGDPSAAMLEVLDPEQNHTFTDHYINVPIDLSKILFIATANSLDTIPPPLLDRMETIQLSGYTTLEKRHIANRHLLPKQVITNGLKPENISLSQDVLDKIITSYTRESGVRNLERELGSVCRYKAVEFAESQDGGTPTTYNPTVTVEDLDTILGIERFEEELAERSSRPGVVTGLVAYSTGGQGSILFIEIADMPGSGSVQLTGTLGDVLKESVEVALSWVKAHAWELGLAHDPTEDIMKNRSIHVHCPSGAIPKDGPSAGLAHTIALISLFSGKSVPPSLAMTGEFSLRGRVLPVGGIKEKLIGALRAGVSKVLLPEGNRKDARDLPDEVKEGLEIVHVQNVWDALKQVWPQGVWDEKKFTEESRL